MNYIKCDKREAKKRIKLCKHFIDVHESEGDLMKVDFFKERKEHWEEVVENFNNFNDDEKE